MKNILLIICFIAVLKSYSQEITKESLQGKWELVAMDGLHSEGFYLDFIKEDYKLSEELQNSITSENSAQIKSSILQIILNFKGSNMDFKEDTIPRHIMSETDEGTFSVRKINDKFFRL